MQVPPSLLDAIEQEALVTDDDIVRCMRRYYARMNPGLPIVVCGACCDYDVPIEELHGQSGTHVWGGQGQGSVRYMWTCAEHAADALAV